MLMEWLSFYLITSSTYWIISGICCILLYGISNYLYYYIYNILSRHNRSVFAQSKYVKSKYLKQTDYKQKLLFRESIILRLHCRNVRHDFDRDTRTRDNF